MRILFNYCCALALLLSAENAHSQTKRQTAVIELVTDSACTRDSLQFAMCRSVNSYLANDQAIYNFRISRRRTRLVIQLDQPLSYGRLKLLSPRLEKASGLNYSNNVFLFRAGDRVTLHLSAAPGGTFFSGKDAARYNCLYALCRHRSIDLAPLNALSTARKWQAAYATLIPSRDSLYALDLRILDSYKSRLDPLTWRLLRLDTWSYCNEMICGYLLAPFYNDQYEAQEKAAKALFLTYYADYRHPGFGSPALQVQSYWYGDYLNFREYTHSIITHASYKKRFFRSYSFRIIDSALNAHYPRGILRDKLRLLACLNLDLPEQSDYVNYIGRAIREAQGTPFGLALLAFKKAHTTGSAAFPFSLPDQEGKYHTLSEFGGKIIVLDFWFTGCHACPPMGDSLKKVLPAYRDDPRIVFLTVSTDRDQQMWLNSVHQGRYCSPDELNLREGLNGQSAFMRHYNIVEYPTLMVFSKEGGLITLSPPDPRKGTAPFTAFLNSIL